MQQQPVEPIQYLHVKPKIEFLKGYWFSDNETETIANITPAPDKISEFVQKDSLNKSVQCGTQYAEHEVKTVRLSYENRGMNHTEGGWPKDVNPTDPEQTVRFKKKIEKDDMYIYSVHQLTHTMEHCILQNNAVDIYEQYFEETEETNTINEKYSCKTLNVFRDPSLIKRPVQHISWSPDGGTHLASSYCNLNFQKSAKSVRTDSYIWEIENPNKPEMILESDVSVVCLEYNPKDPHILIGGLYNGQVAFWDTRKGIEPAEISPSDCSHKDPALHTLWINSKSGTEFFSSSPDGQLKWWDIRKISEPLETLIVDLTKGEAQKLTRAHGVSVLEYENSIPIRFMVGTETGLVVSGNRKGKSPAEKLIAQYKVHHGPVYSLQRNPSFVKIFLTVGDWCAKIWSEDCRESAIMWTNFHEARLTSGAWNPMRYSIFYTTRTDGSLDLWDFLHQQKEATLNVKVCDEPLRTIRCHESGQSITVGNDNGSIYLLQLSENLAVSAKNDKAHLTAMFERECRREKIIESKMKEMRLKTKVGRVIDSHIATKDIAKSNTAINMDQTYIQAAEKEFLTIIEEESTSRQNVKDMVEE